MLRDVIVDRNSAETVVRKLKVNTVIPLSFARPFTLSFVRSLAR